jgi:hypothetical protein
MGKTISVPGLGRRSGLFGPNSNEAAAADLIAKHTHLDPPRGLMGSAPAGVEDYIARQGAADTYRNLIAGPRSDNPTGYPFGTGPRLTWDENDITRWLADGTEQHPIWA